MRDQAKSNRGRIRAHFNDPPMGALKMTDQMDERGVKLMAQKWS